MSAFLEVVTRTFVGRRPDLLLRCHRSLLELEDDAWTHTVLVDPAPFGVGAANGKLASFEAQGDWVWVLDDDDVCCHPGLVGALLWLAETRCPDAVIVKGRWVERDIVLPQPAVWGKRPAEGQIGAPCVITRRDVWNEHRHNWGERYAGDFDFIDGLFDAGLEIAWLDMVVVEVSAANNGRPG